MEIFFSAGEPSGDQHTAHLIQELKRHRPDLRCTGFGGPRMEQAGCELHYPLTDLAVMGFFRVLPLVRKFFKLAKDAERYFHEHKPDAVVLVDFPGFNWSIARRAKEAGIPVFYFLPPQIWAWATWRVKRMRKYVDHVLCGLSFEPDWYAQRGMDVEFVGHPFFDEVAHSRLDETFLERQRQSGQKIVGVLPGSRNHEVHSNFPEFLKVIDRCEPHFDDTKFLVANYRESHQEYCERQYRAWGKPLPIEFHVGKTSEIIESADCCLMVSGSVSLELLARTTPAVVNYQCGAVLYTVANLLGEIDYISLPNLFAGREVYPEFYSVRPSPKNVRKMHSLIDYWLSDPEGLAAKRRELEKLKSETVAPGAIAQTAAAILDKLPASPAISRAA
jgi:lipid-A-disaccharide synthase